MESAAVGFILFVCICLNEGENELVSVGFTFNDIRECSLISLTLTSFSIFLIWEGSRVMDSWSRIDGIRWGTSSFDCLSADVAWAELMMWIESVYLWVLPSSWLWLRMFWALLKTRLWSGWTMRLPVIGTASSCIIALGIGNSSSSMIWILTGTCGSRAFYLS